MIFIHLIFAIGFRYYTHVIIITGRIIIDQAQYPYEITFY